MNTTTLRSFLALLIAGTPVSPAAAATVATSAAGVRVPVALVPGLNIVPQASAPAGLSLAPLSLDAALSAPAPALDASAPLPAAALAPEAAALDAAPLSASPANAALAEGTPRPEAPAATRSALRSAAASSDGETPAAPAQIPARIGQKLADVGREAAFDGRARGTAFMPSDAQGPEGVALDAYPSGAASGALAYERAHPTQPARRSFLEWLGGAAVPEQPIELAGNPQTAEDVELALRALVRSEPARFGRVPEDSLVTASARKVDGREGLADSVLVNFHQVHNGMEVTGTHLRFTVKLQGGKAFVVSSSARLYPVLATEATESFSQEQLMDKARERLGPAGASANLLYLDKRVMHVGDIWRTLAFFQDRASGLLLGVDVFSGQAFAWNTRLNFGVQGSAAGRGVLFDPAKTGSNLNVLALPQLEIRTSQGKVFYSDEKGNFTVEGDGDAPVTITARLTGRFVNVKNDAGADLTVTATAKPGERLQILFNPEGAEEQAVAQVNAYHHVTRVHQFLKDRGFAHDGLAAAITAKVNEDDECNAFYDYVMLNMFKSSPNCRNTAIDTVLIHEFGHHWHLTATRKGVLTAAGFFARALLDSQLRAMAAGGISEGWGDILAMFVTGQPITGEGFFADDRPNNWIREGNNKYQFRRGDEVHKEGQAWMGFAWKLRKALVAALGEAKGAAVAENLILPVVFTGVSDIPAAMRQVLLRDDGTYRDKIIAAAKAHGIDLTAQRSDDDGGEPDESGWLSRWTRGLLGVG
jgi:hypothetical protein